MFSLLKCKFRIVIFLLAIITISSSIYTCAQTGSWVPLTNTLPGSDASGGVMILMTDGTVLCKTTSGGGDGNGNKWDKLTPVNGSYINGTWSTTVAPMHYTRLYFSTQILPDGRLYVAGGEYGTGGPNGEVYDPKTNTWTQTGGPGYTFNDNISDANSEILYDGRVLQACVDTPGTVMNFYWNPVTNLYSLAPSCLRVDNEAVWVKLPDSSIIFQDNYSTTSERYRQQTNTWVNDGVAPTNLFDPFGSENGAGYLLPNGKVFFIGSRPFTLYYTPSGNATPGTWTNGPAIPGSYGAADAASSMMVNGKILMALSPQPTSSNHFPSPTKYYEFDYTTNTFTQVGAPGGGMTTSNSCYISTMLALPDGSILFCNQGDNQYYEYVPGTGAIAAGQPTINTVTRLNCDTFQVTGTLFNGISEGAAYGDDWQMSTNYPIIRLTSGTNVYYATTYNWNRIGAVMTGTLPDTAIFQLPAGLPAGTYSVTVVANGNPSAPFTINTNLTISPSPVSLCAGNSTTLTCSTGGTWSSANSAIATIGSTTGIVTGNSIGTTTITYTIGTCSTTASISVFAAPSTITGTPTVCQGSTTSLSDPIIGGTWSSSATTIATVDLSGNVLGVASGISTITYQPVSGCPATLPVTVNPQPISSITASGATTFCTGSNVTLTGTAGLGFTFQWLDGGAIIGGATNSTFLANATGNYAVLIHNANGCFDTSAITAVTVSSTISATPTISLLTSGCAVGSTAIFSATCASASSYSWAVSGTGWTGVTSSTSDSFLVTIGTGATGTITCSGVNLCGSGSLSTTSLTPAGIGAASPIFATTGICSGGTATFITSTITAATNYVWTVSGAGWSGTSSTNIITLTVGSVPAVISVYGTNACGSGASYTLSSVLPTIPPTANFSVAHHTIGIGIGDLLTYTGSASTFGSYSWNFGGGSATPGIGVGPQTVTWATTGLKTITLSVVDSGCSSTIFTDTVLVLTTTSIDAINESNDNFIIYPNPNNGQFYISSNNGFNNNVLVKLTDMEGRVIYVNNFNCNNNSLITVSNNELGTGVYMVTIITENSITNKKLIISK